MANDVQPRTPYRPLFWPDTVYDLQDALAGADGPVYIVGGAVRDALMQRPLKDIDLISPGSGIRMARRIANMLKGDFFVLDAERDVGRALIATADGQLIFDVAGFRGETLADDLADRDFTINAMAADLNQPELLIDPLDGESDIRAKVLRRCHADSLRHDPLRALRAVRQSVQLQCRIERETLLDIRAVLSDFRQTSPERIRDEFVKLLALTGARQALRVADAVGLLECVLPGIGMMHGVAVACDDYANGWQQTLAMSEKLMLLAEAVSLRRSDHTGATFGIGMLIMQFDRYRAQLRQQLESHWPNERPHSALLMLALLACEMPDAPDVALQWAQALRLSNAERDRLLMIVRHADMPFALEDTEPLTLHRFWWAVDVAGVDICLLAAARYLGREGSALNQDAWLLLVERLLLILHAWYEQYDTIVAPPVLLNGDDLIQQFSLRPSPMIGELLQVIREAQVTGEVTSVEQAQAFVRRHLDTTG